MTDEIFYTDADGQRHIAGADIPAGEVVYFDAQGKVWPIPLPNEPEIRKKAQDVGLDPDGAVYWLRRLEGARSLGLVIIENKETPDANRE